MSSRNELKEFSSDSSSNVTFPCFAQAKICIDFPSRRRSSKQVNFSSILFFVFSNILSNPTLIAC